LPLDAFLEGEALEMLPFEGDEFWVRDAFVGRQQDRGEGAGGVFAGEVPGLGGREEELFAGRGVDEKVVDGLVGSDSGGRKGSFRQHGEDGVVVGFGEFFALRKRELVEFSCKVKLCFVKRCAFASWCNQSIAF
jgi:hypothetical protein